MEALTHPDPYPYYRDLVLHRPLYYDAHLKCWVASSAAVVQTILTHPACAVRPVDEPIPPHLVGTRVGAVYHGWVRMREGDYHQQGKAVIQSVLQELDPQIVFHISQTAIQEVFEELQIHQHPQRLDEFVFHAPIRAMSHMLGIPSDVQLTIAAAIAQVIRALSPPTWSGKQVRRPSITYSNPSSRLTASPRTSGSISRMK
jgi:cytochrome P450